MLPSAKWKGHEFYEQEGMKWSFDSMGKRAAKTTPVLGVLWFAYNQWWSGKERKMEWKATELRKEICNVLKKWASFREDTWAQPETHTPISSHVVPWLMRQDMVIRCSNHLVWWTRLIPWVPESLVSIQYVLSGSFHWLLTVECEKGPVKIPKARHGTSLPEE